MRLCRQVDDATKPLQVEDRARVREDIIACFDDVGDQLLEGFQVPEKKQEETLVQTSVCTLREILLASKLTAVANPLEPSGQRTAALKRFQALLPWMRAFMRKVRIEEGLLSPACVQMKRNAGLNPYNKLAHELKLARMAAEVSGTRCSRSSLWFGIQQQIASKCAAKVSGPAGKSLRPVEVFRPNCVSPGFSSGVDDFHFALCPFIVVPVCPHPGNAAV